MPRKPYVREVPRFSWWLRKKFYTEYMMREATCVAISLYSALLVAGVIALAKSEAAYAGWLAWMHSTGGVVLQLILGAFAVYHTVTWFKLAPKGMPPMRFKGERVPARTVVLAHYAGWAGVSLVILLFVGFV